TLYARGRAQAFGSRECTPAWNKRGRKIPHLGSRNARSGIENGKKLNGIKPEFQGWCPKRVSNVEQKCRFYWCFCSFLLRQTGPNCPLLRARVVEIWGRPPEWRVAEQRGAANLPGDASHDFRAQGYSLPRGADQPQHANAR